MNDPGTRFLLKNSCAQEPTGSVFHFTFSVFTFNNLKLVAGVCAMPTSEVNIALIVLIQKHIRGWLGRKHYSRLKKEHTNRVYQNNFADAESVNNYKFTSHGAAFDIQTWFRSLTFRRKQQWRSKHARFMEKRVHDKALFRAVIKSKSHRSSFDDLSNYFHRQNVSALVICRLVRGYIGRRKAVHLQVCQSEVQLRENRCAVIIQAFARRGITISKNQTIGQRFRMLDAKRRNWEVTNRIHAKDPTEDAKPIGIDDVDGDDIYSEAEDSLALKASNSAADAKRVDVDNQLSSSTRVKREYNLAVPTRFLKRRPSFLFPTLRLGNIHHLKLLRAFTLKIQCAWRQHRARLALQQKIQSRRFLIMARIHVWCVKVHRKWRKSKALRFIQPFWKFKAYMNKRRAIGATKFQCTWRTYLHRRNFKRLLRLRSDSADRIAHWFCICRAHRERWKRVRRGRQLLELKDAGLSCFTATRSRWVAHYMWQGIKTKNHAAQHELQKVFVSNCINGGLESAKMIKLAKDCKELVNDKDLTPNQVEIQFTKVKNPSEKRINYQMFVELCTNLAIIRILHLDPGKVHVDSTSSSALLPSVEAMGMNDPPALRSFEYAGLVGRPALLVTFILTYVSTSSDFKRVAAFLDSKGMSADALTGTLLRDSVLSIQSFVRNRNFVRHATAVLASQKLRKVQLRENRAANIIQSGIRGFLGRKFIIRLAQALYNKYIDGETEQDYWFNPRTERSFWTKPLLLGPFDCGMATRMPREEERVTIICRTCESNTATCFCDQCDEPFCTMCYALNHRTGQRKLHSHLLIENCGQCEFQAGTRYCVSCKDNYCDSCFKFIHRKGRLRFHVVQRNCEACEECGDLSAQWTESFLPDGQSDYHSKLWCNVCYKNTHGLLPADATPSRSLVKIPFFGRSVKLHRDKLAAEARKAGIKAAFENRKREIFRLKQATAALTIQRVHRGRLKRIEMASFLLERREFLRLRKVEEKDRRSVAYKIAQFFGIAKRLQSDTPLERVMKMYPAYMHHILELSVQGKWSEACRLLIEHEQHLNNAPKTNSFQRVSAKISVMLRKRWNRHAERVLEETLARAQSTTASYQIAEESGALAPSKIKALKAAMNAAEKDRKKAAKQKAATNDALQSAEARLTDCIGPRGLQKLVKQRRSEGMQLPFRLTIRKFSRLALVTWETDLDLAEEEKDLHQQFPGRWKEHLKALDTITIRGGSYRVMPPIVRNQKKKKRPDSASSATSSASAGSSGSGGSDGSKSGTPSYGRRRKKKKAEGDESSDSKKLKRPSSAASDSSAGSGSKTSDEAGKEEKESTSQKVTAPVGWDVELKEECTDNHIKLDRPWMLDDVEHIEVFKVLPRIFYYKPFFYARRQVISTYPVQKSVAIAAITLHKYSNLLEWFASNFDADSESFARYNRSADQAKLRRDEWLLLTDTIVQMSFDFALRRQVFSILRSVYQLSSGVLRFLRGLMKSAAGGSKETPYEYWKRSLDKTEISVVLDRGNDRTTTLGEIKLDLKAPAEIMREFIFRAFRTELNTSIGQSFLFFRLEADTGKEKVLSRDDEYKTYSRDFCSEKTDYKTMLTSQTVLIMPDPDRGRLLIPEFEAENEEEENIDQEIEALL